MNVFIETHGCELNKAESSSIANILTSHHHIMVDNPQSADVIILNTCSVRESAETRIFGQLGQYKALAENGVILILTGCMAEHDADNLKRRFPYITHIVSNNNKINIPSLIEASIDSNNRGLTNCEKYNFMNLHYSKGDIESYVPIQNGCNNFCSYCIVPYTRGREVSRPLTEIISELHEHDKLGSRVVTLLGQNVNSYKDISNGFEELVCQIDKQDFKNIRWLNFESPHPKDFSLRLIDILSTSRYFAHHYHIPIQSANDRILKLMNRHYTKKDIYALFDNIRKKIPDATFSSDIMIGFPTETEEEANETIEFIKQIGFIDNFMYFYNPRPLTLAQKNYTDLPLDVKKSRLSHLIEVQGEISKAQRKKMIGTTLEVIVKSKSKDKRTLCISKQRIGVLVEGEYNIGDVLKVRITSVSGSSLVADILKN